MLVVDDDDVSRLVAAGLLRRLGLTVELASEGREALELSSSWPYVAIFMDCSMPDIDGYTAARRIARREGLSQHTPVIAMTSHPRSVSLASGMDHHVAKPLLIDALRADCIRLGLLPRDGATPSDPDRSAMVEVPLLTECLETMRDGGSLRALERGARFVEQAVIRLPLLWRAANSSDRGVLGRTARELRQRAAFAGAARIADLCEQLCAAADNGDTALAAGMEPRVREAVADTAEQIRARVDHHPPREALVPHTEPVALADSPALAADLPVRVAIADDDPLARAAIQAMLQGADGLALVGVAADVQAIIDLALLSRPDVVLLDWMMPGGGGSLAARRIIVHNPETRIVALSSFDSREISSEMTRAGACAFIAKGCSAADLADAIHAAVGTNAQTTP